MIGSRLSCGVAIGRVKTGSVLYVDGALTLAHGKAGDSAGRDGEGAEMAEMADLIEVNKWIITVRGETILQRVCRYPWGQSAGCVDLRGKKSGHGMNAIGSGSWPVSS